MKLTPVHAFALKAALWLPLSFVVWFGLAPLWVLPPTVLAREVLLGFWPSLFTALAQGGDVIDASGRVIRHAGYLLTLSTSIVVHVPASAGVPGGVGVLEPTLNPMIYAYSLPLFSGLAMATPLSGRRRLFQIALAFVVIWLAQAFGIVAESLKFVAVDSGADGAAAAARAGLSTSAIALRRARQLRRPARRAPSSKRIRNRRCRGSRCGRFERARASGMEQFAAGGSLRIGTSGFSWQPLPPSLPRRRLPPTAASTIASASSWSRRVISRRPTSFAAAGCITRTRRRAASSRC
jgi:hypothetical protein